MLTAEATLFLEIENAVAGASADRRREMVRQLADLFVSRSDEMPPELVSIFDDIIVRLASEIEQHARALLSRRLAPIRNAPPNVVRVLAFDDAIEVAGPVLTQSARLDDKTLVEIVQTKGQDHMLAISQRGALNEIVTDALVELGNREVVLNALDNFGASFSNRGFSVLVSRSQGDDFFAELVGSRPEIPSDLLVALVAKASQDVRSKLEAAHPRAKAEVRRAVAEAAGHVESHFLSMALNYTAAIATVERLQRSGQLNEAALARFAKSSAYPETIAALAAMCGLPLNFVEQAMIRDRSETLLVLAKAAGLSWSTAQDILRLRAENGIIPPSEIIHHLARFERLQPATAREVVLVFRNRVKVKATAAAMPGDAPISWDLSPG
jgi:uncharacterized protein (DUF2336 family)